MPMNATKLLAVAAVGLISISTGSESAPSFLAMLGPAPALFLAMAVATTCPAKTTAENIFFNCNAGGGCDSGEARCCGGK